jgi:hypothetical protein
LMGVALKMELNSATRLSAGGCRCGVWVSGVGVVDYVLLMEPFA